MTLQRVLIRLPKRLQWTLHNIVAHPVSEILYQVNLHRWSNLVHDRTVPGTAEGPSTSDAAKAAMEKT